METSLTVCFKAAGGFSACMCETCVLSDVSLAINTYSHFLSLCYRSRVIALKSKQVQCPRYGPFLFLIAKSSKPPPLLSAAPQCLLRFVPLTCSTLRLVFGD